MKARNLSSPDRADALLGAIWASFRGSSGVWTGEATGLCGQESARRQTYGKVLSHLGLFVAHFDIVVPSLTLGR